MRLLTEYRFSLLQFYYIYSPGRTRNKKKLLLSLTMDLYTPKSILTLRQKKFRKFLSEWQKGLRDFKHILWWKFLHFRPHSELFNNRGIVLGIPMWREYLNQTIKRSLIYYFHFAPIIRPMVSFSPEKYSDLVNFRGWVGTIVSWLLWPWQRLFSRPCQLRDIYSSLYWYIKYNDKL